MQFPLPAKRKQSEYSSFSFLGSVFSSTNQLRLYNQGQLTASVSNPSHVLISYSFSRFSDPDLESDQVAIPPHSFHSVV